MTSSGSRPPTAGEAAPAEIDAATREEVRALLHQVEAVDWCQVPGVSAATAAAFATSLEQVLEVPCQDDARQTHPGETLA